MNTKDIKYNGEIKNLKQFYKLVEKQFLEYEKIEGIDNWKEYDFSLDCPQDQMKLKDMFQIRCIEEITEASSCLDEPEDHFWEEIADVLNFFLSGYVMMGKDLTNLPSPSEILLKESRKTVLPRKEFALSAYMIIEDIGYMCNLLKNRPWAETNYLVSRFDFEERANRLWFDFWFFLRGLGLSVEDVFEMFWKKYVVNNNRRKSRY